MSMKDKGIAAEMKVKRLTMIGHPLKRAMFFTSVFAFLLLLLATYCLAAERIEAGKTTITSETLQYEEASTTYIAKGRARIQRGEAVLEADEIRYNETTSDAFAFENVKYQDPDVTVIAKRANVNLDAKTGVLYDSEILFKRDNYHFAGKEIEKRGEEYYFSPDASFTTCDAPVPAWCFKGKDVNIQTGDSVKAKKVSFRILDLPVLYTPYFQAPLMNERKTGFLIPVIGYSDSKGVRLNVPFYVVLSENRDATIVLDEYTRRGLGEGLEYRYLEQGGAKGRWWLYHLSDRVLDKDFFEARVTHEQRSNDGLGGYLSINYLNGNDFFREYSLNRDVRVSRFLDSTGELNLPLSNSRAYLLSQYWVDLQQETKAVAQRMPEAGYVLNPTKLGNFWFMGTAAVSNFWSETSVGGQRLDVFPRVLHSFGDEVTVTQSVGLRETAYSLKRWSDNSPHREALEYDIAGHMSFFKKYDSFTHVIEPTLGYTLITDSEDKNLPIFDSTELYKKTSTVAFALLNRFYDKSGEFLAFRLSQGYDFSLKDKEALPFHVEVGLKRPLSVRFEAIYDVNTGNLKNANSDVTVPFYADNTISAGQRYNAQDDTSFVDVGVNLHPYKPLFISGSLWYDTNAKEVRDAVLNLRYMKQCWGINLQFNKRPGDFSTLFMLQLKGITKDFKT